MHIIAIYGVDTKALQKLQFNIHIRIDCFIRVFYKLCFIISLNLHGHYMCFVVKGLALGA